MKFCNHNTGPNEFTNQVKKSEYQTKIAKFKK